eukprot:2361698-Heterocapsa_arctica.AAC.1
MVHEIVCERGGGVGVGQIRGGADLEARSRVRARSPWSIADARATACGVLEAMRRRDQMA